MLNRFLTLFRPTEPTTLKEPVTVEATKTTYVFEPKVMAIHRLRVNVKSLAAEAKIIRREERRAGYGYQHALQSHRRGRLREESRYAQLALAFVRGMGFKRVDSGLKPITLRRLVNKINKAFYPADGVSNDTLDRFATGEMARYMPCCATDESVQRWLDT